MEGRAQLSLTKRIGQIGYVRNPELLCSRPLTTQRWQHQISCKPLLPTHVQAQAFREVKMYELASDFALGF